MLCVAVELLVPGVCCRAEPLGWKSNPGIFWLWSGWLMLCSSELDPEIALDENILSVAAENND